MDSSVIEEKRFDLGDKLFRVGSLAFPDNAYAPPLPAQITHVLLVSRLIPQQFGAPVLLAGFRHTVTVRAAVLMPKTTMNEYYSPAGREHEVRTAWQRFDVQPVANPKCVNKAPDCHFRLCILVADKRHSTAALLPCQIVHRGTSGLVRQCWRIFRLLEVAFLNIAPYLVRQQWWHGVPNLGELSGGGPQEFKVIRERLKTSAFPHAQCTRDLWVQVRTTTAIGSSSNDGIRW